MDYELFALLRDWSITGGMLVLVYTGHMQGGHVAFAVTLIIGIDFARILSLFREMKRSGELDNRLDDQ
jgi:hypothetical protein